MRLFWLFLLVVVLWTAMVSAESWVAVSKHTLEEHQQSLTFSATIGPKHILRHEQIGQYHIYVLDEVEEGHVAHSYFAGHPATHMLVRNHDIEAIALPPVRGHGFRTRIARYNPWKATQVDWMVEGASCRTNTNAEGRRGYSAGGFSWGIDSLDQGQATLLDNTFCTPATGNTSHVYILDTGVDPHPSFRFPVQQDYSWYTAMNQASLSNKPPPSTPALNTTFHGDFPIAIAGDCHGHGTHVAGLAASTIYGVAPDAIVHAIQVLDCDGRGSFDALIAGLLYVMEYGERPAVINLSSGVLNVQSSSVAMLIEELTSQHGVPVVASAGNNGVEACDFFPANVPEAITVAASNEQHLLANFSNHGPCVDVVAPGTSIISCTPNSGAALLSGTSMAAPMVTGIMALLQQEHPEHAGNVPWLTDRLKTLAQPLLQEPLLNTPNAMVQVTPDPNAPPAPSYHLPPYYNHSGADAKEENLWVISRALMSILVIPFVLSIFF